MTAMRISVLGTSLHVCNPALLEIIAKRFLNDISQLRLKDMERFAYVMVLFDLAYSSNTVRSLANAMLCDLPRRTDEIREYPNDYVTCIYYLAMLGFHDADLIASVLDPSNIERIDHSSTNALKIIFLDSFTRINLRNSYNNRPQLCDSTRRTLVDKCIQPLFTRRKIWNAIQFDELITDIADTVKLLFGDCVISHALPHFAKPGMCARFFAQFYIILNVYNCRYFLDN